MTPVLGLRLNWQREASRLSQAGVAGPLFISVGQPEQLQQFLDINPELKDAKALIDDSADLPGTSRWAST